LIAGLVVLGSLSAVHTQVEDPVFFRYSPETGWTIGNERVRARFQMGADQTFQWVDLADASGRVLWQAAQGSPSSPIDVQINDEYFDARTPLRLVGQQEYSGRNNGRGFSILFRDLSERFEFEVLFEIHPGHPVIHQRLRVKNLRASSIYIRGNNILPYEFENEDESSVRVFRVNQWSVLDGGRNFEPYATPLEGRSQKVSLLTGAGGLECTWFAIARADDTGVFAGWEFDGLADATVKRTDTSLALGVSPRGLHHPVTFNDVYESPASFIGVFQGDWDEAGFRTQRYAEAAIAPRTPDANFPYIAWDSWGYEKQINEATLRREVDIAAEHGVELFIVDLGWAKQMGEWVEDPAKFPSGMRALSDYVHSKGMKFGLHFVISEAMANSPVLRENPSWACSTNYNYHGAVSLALGHRPVQDWVIEEGVRMIREFNVDWVLQDGQTMVKECKNTGLSYDPRDWNYAGHEGLNRILREIQARTPGVVWENCANGGNMMTFSMVRNYVTSITNDASGSLGARQGMFGATFPFPPRYTDRYMPAAPMTAYNTRSFMFGGPWILMNKLTQLSKEDLAFLDVEVERFKELRHTVQSGKVMHLTDRPELGAIDAIQSFNASRGDAVAFVMRDNAEADGYQLVFRGLWPQTLYRVTFADDPRELVMSGAQLMSEGVDVKLPERESGEIVYARPLGY
jgi:alpha-galactosidase